MLIKIGPLQESSDVVDLLLQCHDRIRSFVDLAGRLAGSHDSSENEIRDAASRVSRYFTEALPLHVADEEQSIVPRLTGKTADIDSALQGMHGEHMQHEANVKRVIEICDRLKAFPGSLDRLRKQLSGVTSSLQEEFATHLKREEDVIFPAIRSLLSPEDQAGILTEVRGRRNSDK